MILLANVLPIVIIGVAARRRLLAWMIAPAGPPGDVDPPATDGLAPGGADAEAPPPG